MNVRILAPRIVGGLLLGGISFAMLRTTSLLNLSPVPIPAWWLIIPAFLAFAPTLIPRGSPLPLTLTALLPIFLTASYDQSQLDWLRLLKDFDLVTDAGPSWPRIALGMSALVVAWLVHVGDHALRLEERLTARGITPGQGRAAVRATLLAGLGRLGMAFVGTLALAGVVAVANLIGVDRLLGGRSALLAPLLAVALLGGAAVALARRSVSTNERQ